MMWDDFLPLGQALEERFPETDVLSVSDAELSRGRSSVWLERMPVTHEVASSSLVVPAIYKNKSTCWTYFFVEICE